MLLQLLRLFVRSCCWTNVAHVLCLESVEFLTNGPSSRPLHITLAQITLVLISYTYSLQEAVTTVLIPRQRSYGSEHVCFRNLSAQATSKERERVITFRVTLDNREKERRRVWFPCSSYLRIEIVLYPGQSSIAPMLFPLIFVSLVFSSAGSDEYRPKVLVYSIQSGFSHVNFMGRVADTLAEGDMDVVS